jgi:diacylglycerol kinase family enzyme
MGGGFMMAPESKVDDAIFDLSIVREIPQLAMFGLIGKFMKGTHASDPAVVTTRSRKVVVTALKGTLPCHADGVTVSENGKELTIEMIPRGLEIITRLTD